MCEWAHVPFPPPTYTKMRCWIQKLWTRQAATIIHFLYLTEPLRKRMSLQRVFNLSGKDTPPHTPDTEGISGV